MSTTNQKRQAKKVLTAISLEDAQQAAQTWAKASTNISTVEAKMNAEIETVKAKYLPKINAYTEELVEPSAVLESYAMENRKEWDKKSLDLLHARIGFATSPPSIGKGDNKTTWDVIAETMSKMAKWKPFVRTKHEIDKKAILAEKNAKTLEALNKDFKIVINQPETFFIEGKKEVLKKK